MRNEPQQNPNQNFTLPNWPYVYGGPPASGTIRSKPSDFFVDEILGYELTGNGEHIWLQLEKIGQNTDSIAKLLAKFAYVKPVDIGFAGLKDRNAITRQWFSVRLPGKTKPDWTELESDTLKLLNVIRNKQKLKRGALAGNAFKLIIRNWQGDKTATLECLSNINQYGLPNYFGLQRFGRNGQNIPKAIDMFQGKHVKRHQRSLYLSAARAFLFNQILAERIKQKNWNEGITGDTYIFDQSKQIFQSDTPDQSIQTRLLEGKIHIAGSLYGTGQAFNQADAKQLEQAIFNQFQELTDGLTRFEVERSYRSLRINVQNLQWQFLDNTTLQLSFNLPSGSYATALLRELIHLE